MHCNKISFYWFKMQQHLIVVMCFSIGWDDMLGPALSIIVYVSVRDHDNLIIRSLEKFFKWKIIVSIKRNICYVLPVRVLLVQFSSVQSSPVQSIAYSMPLQGTGEIGSLYQGFIILGCFSIHLLLLGWRISFVIPRTSLYRGSLNRGYTVFACRHGWSAFRASQWWHAMFRARFALSRTTHKHTYYLFLPRGKHLFFRS